MNQSSPRILLNQRTLEEGVTYLIKEDPDLAKIVDDLGIPPLWSRKPGFSTLIHIILEQQVSLASAKAAFLKLEKAAGKLTPERYLSFSDSELRGFGFSKQKTKYGRELSKAILNNELNLEVLGSLDDASVRQQLTQINGIGQWTANIYLLMALRRPDIWPTGDLALAKAAKRVKKLSKRPTSEQLAEIAEQWKPWRAVAARILWHYYLS